MARRQGGTLGGFTPLSAPSAPTGLSVSSDIGSATVSFTPPTDTGDAAVTSFIVTAVDESTGVSTGATGSASPITISPGGGTFKIRAQAVNGFGPGRLTEFVTGKEIYSGAGMWSFGEADYGRLGDNTVVDKSSPVQIGALNTWSSVSMGGTLGFAVKTDGTLWSWGQAQNGGLGNGDTFTNKSSPIQIGALTTWSRVYGGINKGAAIKTDNTLWAWGINGGALGTGDINGKESPVQVLGGAVWSQASFNYTHSGAVRTNNTAWMWGVNNNGQLGQNNTITTSSPVQVGSLTNWNQLSVSSFSAFATKTDGTLWAWGNNVGYRLGDGTNIARSSPVQIGVATDWASVSTAKGSSSFIHTLAITTSGEIYGWGFGSYGQLGLGTAVNQNSPVQIGILTNWKQAAATSYSSVAVKTDGTMWAWGRNTAGNLGQNNTINSSSPVQIGALTEWIQVSTGGGFSGANQTLALSGVL